MPRSEPAQPLKGKRRLSESSIGLFNSVVMMQSGESKDRLIMHEFVMPFVSKTQLGFLDAITSENAKVPIAMVFIGITLFYQLYWKEGAYFNPNKNDIINEKFDKNNPKHVM